MGDCVFDGEYWNVDAETTAITRLQFTQRADHLYVSAWGSCFPEDCEWGETELHVLNDDDKASDKWHAFATWDFDSEPSHCLFAMDQHQLTVTWISIQSDIPSFKRTMTFRKDAARSAAALNPDPLEKFKHMWDGSEPGWKLIQYRHQVFLVEFNFDESGPALHELPTIVEFVGSFRDESEDQMWERLRGCTGIGMGKPLGPTEMSRLRAIQRNIKLNLTVYTIEPDDYLVLAPNGHHYGWIAFPRYRRLVIDRMIDAGLPVVSGHLE